MDRIEIKATLIGLGNEAGTRTMLLRIDQDRVIALPVDDETAKGYAERLLYVEDGLVLQVRRGGR